jgi:hypothetical protein
MNDIQKDYVVTKQPLPVWAKEMGWPSFDSSVDLYTMDPGATCKDGSCLLIDFIANLSKQAPNLILIVNDRWKMNLKDKFQRAESFSVTQEDYFSLVQPTERELSLLICENWKNIGIYFIGTNLEQRSIEVAGDIQRWQTESIGMNLNSQRSFEFATGHDNNFLVLATRIRSPSPIANFEIICPRYGRTLKFAD